MSFKHTNCSTSRFSYSQSDYCKYIFYYLKSLQQEGLSHSKEFHFTVQRVSGFSPQPTYSKAKGVQGKANYLRKVGSGIHKKKFGNGKCSVGGG